MCLLVVWLTTFLIAWSFLKITIPLVERKWEDAP